MRRQFPIIVEPDRDGVFLVECPVLQGCRSYGNTMNEALENIRETIELCLEDETDIPEENTVRFGENSVRERK